MSNSLEGLPVEMQQRIADIIEQAKANPIQHVGSQAPAFHPVAQQGLVNPGALVQAPAQAPAPPTRPPSLMDHVIALRGEVAELRQENLDLRQQVHASAQVTEAVGQAVGQLYQMFCQQTQTSDHSPTYSSQFQVPPVTDDDF